jgi:hypothetical protein
MPKCVLGHAFTPGVSTGHRLLITTESAGRIARKLFRIYSCPRGWKIPIQTSMMINRPARRNERVGRQKNPYLTPTIAASRTLMSAPKSLPSIPPFLYGLELLR